MTSNYSKTAKNRLKTRFDAPIEKILIQQKLDNLKIFEPIKFHEEWLEICL